MPYVYTPVVQDDRTNHFEPAKGDPGSLESAMSDLVGGIHTLKFDDSVPRYVFDCPDDQPMQTGWESRTKQEVNADYPGLIP
jgi:hypothetical protein